MDQKLDQIISNKKMDKAINRIDDIDIVIFLNVTDELVSFYFLVSLHV